MKKIVIMVLIFTATLYGMSGAKAQDQKVIAILDTYVDSSMSDRIIYEVCTILNNSCLNGTNFMEGKGAANVLPTDLNARGIQHGPQMAATALQANPNTKIIFIRIHNINRYPTFNAIYASDDSIAKGLKWVSENASKFGIDAVSISQARTNFTKGTCPKHSSIESYVQLLKSMSIPVFAGVGNGGWFDRTGFPACSLDVIGIGASTETDVIGMSNFGAGVDFYSIGSLKLLMLNNLSVFGTSVATAYIASVWVNKFSGTWSEQYQLANSSTTTVKQFRGTSKYIFINN